MKTKTWLLLIPGALVLGAAFGQAPPGPASITLDEAIQMALRHNHSLKAARTTVYQNEAQEITANLHPNPTLFVDWEYLPIFSRPEGGVAAYLQGSTEGDIGLSYLLERGQKRAHRLQAAKDATAVTRSQVADTERTLEFQFASLFINVQTAESTLELTQQNQGEIARTHYAITQAQEQRKSVNGQVLTDLRDAYEGLKANDRVIQFYRSGNLEASQRNRDISEYAYQRGAVSLLDFLDTERSYRATQLAYRQALAAYLLSIEQLRQAVGTRSLP